MAADVLIDTSIWIDFFRNRSLPASLKLLGLIDEDRALIAGIVLTELLRGARNDKEMNLIQDLLRPVRRIQVTEGTWEMAGALAYKLSKKGVAVFTVDAIIATIAIEHGVAIFSADKHFAQISRHCALRLF